MTQRVPLAVCLAFALALVGCGALRAYSAKHEYIAKEMQNFVYDRPLAEVWPTAQSVLFEAGYQVRYTDNNVQLSMETEWRYDDRGNTSRILVQGIELDEGMRCQVFFTKQSQAPHATQSNSFRDSQLEFQLASVVEPARAAQIEHAASAEGERAR